MNKFLIACLGNIGSEYEHTRHNAGFLIADQLAAKLNSTFTPGRYAATILTKFKGRSIILLKPTTYMNLSGQAISYWMITENIPTENLLVVLDDLAFPFGQIKIQPKGSDGGHNGLKSIQERIGTSDYPRLRFGIGGDFPKGKQVDYVLGHWTKEESASLPKRIELATEAALSFVFNGLQPTMNIFNSK